jgi:hypothetical protein
VARAALAAPVQLVLDIPLSVHESDTRYDGVPDGYIRIAFGSADPDRWELTTLAEGPEAVSRG